MEKSICKQLCAFYKADKKEEYKCGTYAFLARNLTKTELKRAVEATSDKFNFSEDGAILDMVCKKCEFLSDGCDYRDGVGKTPCGGYAVVEHLLKRPSSISKDL